MEPGDWNFYKIIESTTVRRFHLQSQRCLYSAGCCLPNLFFELCTSLASSALNFYHVGFRLACNSGMRVVWHLDLITLHSPYFTDWPYCCEAEEQWCAIPYD